MKCKILSGTSLLMLISFAIFGQTIKPGEKQKGNSYIVGAVLHLGDGTTVENGFVSFINGKITAVGAMGEMRPEQGAQLYNASGKHIYPGFIAPMTTVGLSEIEAVRATNDFAEVGELNPHVRTAIAYNAGSKIIPTLRTNGVLLAQISPKGGLISGQSSVMQLDAWNWEDATLKADVAIHVNFPSAHFDANDEAKRDAYDNSLAELKSIFDAAKSYSEADADYFNARLNSMVDLFTNTKKLFVRAEYSDDIIKAVTFFKSYGITPVIVGASEAYMVVKLLKDNKISVILNKPHSLPIYSDDDIDMPYKQAIILQEAGILYTFAIDGSWQQRNLPFIAGSLVAYGLTKEQALSLITLNAAKILDVDRYVGSLEVGKDATFFISKGDPLDIKTNDIEKIFVKGKDVSLDNIQKHLYNLYSEKITK